MPPLTAADRIKLEAELQRLETAQEEMITGVRLASVTAPGGRGMGFAAGNQVAVRVRIAEIKRLLGQGRGRFSIRPNF